jgi:hypothetical protein
MAVLLESCECPVCGESHDFCLPSAWIIWWAGEVYAFTCPTTGTRGVLEEPPTPGKPVNQCPTDAVELQRE